jgi:uncharacterized protein HemY
MYATIYTGELQESGMNIAANLEKLLSKGRDDAMLRFGLGSAYFNDGEFGKAATHLEACIAQDNTYSAAYKLLGKALLKLGENARAQAVFAEGLPIAVQQGDKQSEKEMTVFLAKIVRGQEK